MANWLLDYIEMTEYIPAEFRDQSFLMRELDLKVTIAMSDLEQEIKDFFLKIDTLSLQEKQDQYNALLKKCDLAAKAASDKVRLADRLHDLVGKSMRLLDQSLEKLKEDLLEGDKAYIVEDLERQSQELDEKTRLEQETMLQRQHRLKELKSTHSKGHANSNHVNQHNHQNHRHSLPSNKHNHHQIAPNSSQHQVSHQIQRSRNNSTGTQNTSTLQLIGKQKKRERKRLNSTMTIFNRNSRTDDDSTNQTILSSPSTPDYLIGLQNSNSNSLNDIAGGGDNSSLSIKGMIGGNRNMNSKSDKSNGNDLRARQPILTAIDAAHAVVSPNSTKSDKLVLFSTNSNGDNYSDPIHNHNKLEKSLSIHRNHPQHIHNGQLTQLTSQLLSSSVAGYNSGLHNAPGGGGVNNYNNINSNDNHNNDHQVDRSTRPFSTLPLASRHDPIMMAASQAINATQNMTPGRRTSSLKASYAAVNSGRLQPPQDHTRFELPPGEIYCKCRNAIHDPNMIACDNGACEYEWFHYQCVGITTPPEGEWYCDDCRVLMRSQNYITTKKPKTSATIVAGQSNNRMG